MTTSNRDQGERTNSAEKTNDAAGRRLMDLLAGWVEYVDICATYAAEQDQVAELHQAAGQLVFDGATGEDIAHFITSRGIPLVLEGPAR